MMVSGVTYTDEGIVVTEYNRRHNIEESRAELKRFLDIYGAFSS